MQKSDCHLTTDEPRRFWEVKCIIKGRATTGKVTFFINSLSIICPRVIF